MHNRCMAKQIPHIFRQALVKQIGGIVGERTIKHALAGIGTIRLDKAEIIVREWSGMRKDLIKYFPSLAKIEVSDLNKGERK